MRSRGEVACVGEMKVSTKLYSEIMGGNRQPFGKPRGRCVGNIKMNLIEIGCEGRTGFMWLRKEYNASSCEHTNEFFSLIKSGIS
jgi:hypothetical protein